MSEITSKISTSVLEKALENTQKESGRSAPTDTSFQEMLETSEENFRFMDLIGEGENQLLPQGNPTAVSATEIPFDLSGNGGNALQSTQGQGVVDLLSDFNNQQMHMDQLVNEVLYGGKKFSNQELLGIQAHVFQVAQVTEITVKSVDLAVSSFKGVMNTQIQ